jgi:hypothetical protein
LSGADSDRGDIYVRYGPPERMIGLGTDVTDGAGDVVTFWFYPGDMFFAFSGMPTFAVRRMLSSDMPIVVDYLGRRPVRWDNIDMPQVDSLVSTAARFRSAGDSVDVAIVTEFGDPGAIATTMSIVSPVRRNSWIAAADGSGERQQSGVLTAAGPLLWRERIKPGVHIYRIEAFGETATRGGRATGLIDATRADFAATGFGVSDLLFARPAEDGPGAARRWNELELTPSSGSFARGAPVTVVWENYEFGASEGRAQYDVTITLKPERSRGATLRAEILGALARLARIETSNGEVRISVPRDVAHAPAFADWIAISLPDAPAGSYTLTMTVKDRVSGQEATRSARIVVKAQ